MNSHDLKSLVSVPQVLGMYGLTAEKRIPCPIHGGEKNNFAVHEDYFKCFSCGESGDIFSLVQSLSQVDFLEAKKIICNYFNITPTKTNNNVHHQKHFKRGQIKRLALEKEYKQVLKRVRTYQEIRICEALRSVRTLDGDSFLEQHFEGLLERFSQKPEFFISHDIHAHLNTLLQRHKNEDAFIFNNINIQGVQIMSYMVLHMNKFKADAIKGIENHNSRLRKSQSNPDIDYSRAKNNYELLENATPNYAEAIQNRIDDLLLVKAVRKDAVRMCGLIVSSDTAFFEKLSSEEQRRFFEESKSFLSDFVGKENVIAATVHMDEKTPHMHFMHVPITKDGRLNANSIYTRESLRNLQSDLPAYLQSKGFDIQRGVEQEAGAAKKHLNTREYKQKQEELKKLQEQEKALREQVEEYEALVQEAENFLQKQQPMPEASLLNYKSAMTSAKEIIQRQRDALLLQAKHKNEAEHLTEQTKELRQKIAELQQRNQELYDKAVTKIESQDERIARLKKRIDQDRLFISGGAHFINKYHSLFYISSNYKHLIYRIFMKMCLTHPSIAPLHKEFWAERKKEHQEREAKQEAEQKAQPTAPAQQSTGRPAFRMR